jgi:hypothetical protein
MCSRDKSGRFRPAFDEVELFGDSFLTTMRDEFAIEEMRIRAEFEKMDAALCAAMLRAIHAGEEHAPEAICREPGTRKPIFILAN